VLVRTSSLALVMTTLARAAVMRVEPPGAPSGLAYHTKYGRIKARIRVDAGGSDVMSAVALSWPVSNDRGDGELDFYEAGRQRETIRSFVHPNGGARHAGLRSPDQPDELARRVHDLGAAAHPLRSRRPHGMHFQATRPHPGATHRLTFQ
jgi:hypothetical protein